MSVEYRWVQIENEWQSTKYLPHHILVDDSLLGFNTPESGPALSIQGPVGPKLRFIHQKSPWEM